MDVQGLLDQLDYYDPKKPVEIRVSRATVQRAPNDPAALTAMSVREEEDRVVIETMLAVELVKPATEAVKAT